VQGFTTPFVSIYHFGASLKTMHAIGASRPPKHFSGEAITGPIPCRACLYSVSFATQMVPAAGDFNFPARQTVTADRPSLRSRLRMQTVSLSPCRAWFILAGALRGIQVAEGETNFFYNVTHGVMADSTCPSHVWRMLLAARPSISPERLQPCFESFKCTRTSWPTSAIWTALMVVFAIRLLVSSDRPWRRPPGPPHGNVGIRMQLHPPVPQGP